MATAGRNCGPRCTEMLQVEGRLWMEPALLAGAPVQAASLNTEERKSDTHWAWPVTISRPAWILEWPSTGRMAVPLRFSLESTAATKVASRWLAGQVRQPEPVWQVYRVAGNVLAATGSPMEIKHRG